MSRLTFELLSKLLSLQGIAAEFFSQSALATDAGQYWSLQHTVPFSRR